MPRGWVEVKLYSSMTAALEGVSGQQNAPAAIYPLQEAGWSPGPVWTGGKSRPHRDSIPDRPARSSVAIPIELPGPPFIQRIYNYIPEVNRVSKVYISAAVLHLQFVLHVMLFRILNMFCVFTSALSAVCVCSAQYDCFLQSLNFVLSRYVARVLSE